MFAKLTTAWVVVRDRTGRLLWHNAAYADMVERPEGVATGTTFDAMVPANIYQDRMRLVRQAIESNSQYSYVQLMWGRRTITHVWPLDPSDFPDGGWLAVGEPGFTARGDDLPLAEVPHWGQLESLSRRELEVLYYVAKGCTLAETAAAVHRSAKTIERHVSSLHRKLHLRGRAAVVRFAAERGLHAFTPEQWRRLTEHRRSSRPAGDDE
jgi:DNA-binding CsgD family transcriptional regulator